MYPIDINRDSKNIIKYFFIFPILKYTYKANSIEADNIPKPTLRLSLRLLNTFKKLRNEVKNKANTNKFLFCIPSSLVELEKCIIQNVKINDISILNNNIIKVNM
mgnify:CR=1 FL=1